MTPEDLAAIRARHAEAPSVYVVPADTPAGLIELVLHQASPAIADRRALLAEVDRLTRETIPLTAALDLAILLREREAQDERARIRAAVEGLRYDEDYVDAGDPADAGTLGWNDALRAVLAAIDGDA